MQTVARLVSLDVKIRVEFDVFIDSFDIKLIKFASSRATKSEFE